MEVELRRIGADDWQVLRDVRLRALADSPDAFRRTLAETEADAESLWRQRAAGPGAIVVVYEDARPVAMGGVLPLPGRGQSMIWGMWTAPESRGRGHGARVLRELVAWSRERGLTVALHVTDGNDAARGLYLANGFEPTGLREPLREGSELQIEELRLRST